jgi:NAD(P)-dependent dehydrogenase (short-subunit alcohol dehydrogenase family)
MKLKGKTAIVTGGGTGIGESVSLKLASRGVNVIVNYSKSQAVFPDPSESNLRSASLPPLVPPTRCALIFW